ncbi:MAG: DNA-processing protein DprA [Patescibacteria group bacterium]|nr:DNA-processing protein DprA [Patescibacteria group bacterium]
MTQDEKYFVALSTFTQFGSVKIEALINYFESPERIWKASKSELVKTGLSERLVEEFCGHRDKFDLDDYLRKLAELRIEVITKSDPNYPFNLKSISNAPFVLYCKGKILPSDSTSIAVIGTRKMTNYGRDVAEHFTKSLVEFGVTIVSGLAFGVDSIAHETAILHKGRTIAVIGCGLDRIYPAGNLNLAKKIIENGAILSEYPLGYPAFRSNFAARNRIISGLSKGVLVVEGEKRSGTLLTASHAADQGRTVYAVPGSIFSVYSQASHYLIQNGAQIAVSPHDIIADIGATSVLSCEVHSVLPTDEIEEKIYSLLVSDSLHLDELSRIIGLRVSEVSQKLTVMELKGIVKHIGNGIYRKC